MGVDTLDLIVKHLEKLEKRIMVISIINNIQNIILVILISFIFYMYFAIVDNTTKQGGIVINQAISTQNDLKADAKADSKTKPNINTIGNVDNKKSLLSK